MGLKIDTLNSSGATGRLDGLPFLLAVEDDGWRAEVGDAARPVWKSAVRMDPEALPLVQAPAEVRSIAYRAVAAYRNACRPSPATA